MSRPPDNPPVTTEYNASTFESLASMEGVAVQLRGGGARRYFPGRTFLRSIYPGFIATLTIAAAAEWLSQHYLAPVMLFALLLGMAFHFLHEERRWTPGIEFASKIVLRIGVALLGARITVNQLLELGFLPIALVILGISTTMTLGALLARWLRLPPAFGVLTGGAVGICGASAALAIGSVLPRTPESERNIILTVVVVTALSTIAMLTYPIIAGALGLNQNDAGIFLGGTIHDVAQVVGAGYAVSPKTGDVATYVKLLRVTMLLPVVFGLVLFYSRQGGASTGAPKLPLFLLAFALFVALNSLSVLPRLVIDACLTTSHWCLVTAIAALGTKTALKSLVSAGWRPVGLMVIETLWIGGLVLIAIKLFA